MAHRHERHFRHQTRVLYSSPQCRGPSTMTRVTQVTQLNPACSMRPANPMPADPRSPGPAALSEPLLTIRETATILRQHRKTVERWAREGKIASYRVGSRILFRRSDVLQWLGERRTEQFRG